MFAIDFKLALWSLLLFPLLIVVVRVLQHFQRKAYQNLSNKQSNVNAFIHESIAGVKTTQTFTREHEQYETFQHLQGEQRSAWMRAVHIQFLLWPSMEIISMSTMALIYYVGIMHVAGVTATTGTLIAFVGYANNFWNPVINIGNFYNQLITCSAYLERIFETLDVQPDIVDKPGAEPLPPIRGDVRFDDVVFRYEPDGRNILDHVDLHAKPGQTVALVGPTGAGKTTIVNLLSRFYDVADGAVLIDGHDVRDVTLDSLRLQMGVMLQDTFIFSGTIRENIRYGKLDATDEQIIAAAKAVHAHEFIEELPDGYDTVVQERGSTLSMGQRQLIAFARAARRPAHPHSRRGGEQHRHPHRGGAAGGVAAHARRTHEFHHRAPIEHDRECRHDLRRRPRPDRRTRHARGPHGQARRILASRGIAVCDDFGRRLKHLPWRVCCERNRRGGRRAIVSNGMLELGNRRGNAHDARFGRIWRTPRTTVLECPPHVPHRY
ncbi:ABC-type multidrug transport system ATPase and pe rmease component [Bifidobacterium animalis subsp. animalis IM386]|uniref:ABC-type multidrug transport system ATPase and pe rmease component n=1 Tax=Bifidobacterium animalis subsp. animalis IM386 TaxID=1402194 RepID=A0AAV2W137_9BIFI|nr:ABC-type multidrug transport system ATPase and permease component [Bifidobacterium animalis subsp. animalis ATCC 25527]AYN24303.1 multidrug ABC transporter ATPase/permease [Bifidobacterium animalis subsp. animalis]CDI66894.1 ABC-type multidrug transport system ATPase and pe rmease component [Bifidobacterium animalis subsp. animalis IM386]